MLKGNLIPNVNCFEYLGSKEKKKKATDGKSDGEIVRRIGITKTISMTMTCATALVQLIRLDEDRRRWRSICHSVAVSLSPSLSFPFYLIFSSLQANVRIFPIFILIFVNI